MPKYKVKYLAEKGKLSGNTITAAQFRVEDGFLFFEAMDGRVVAAYAEGLWLSVREIEGTEEE